MSIISNKILTRKYGLWILFVIFLSYMVSFIDRTNVIVLINDISFTDAFGITANKATQGLLLTIFLLFSGISAFFSGPIVNRFGARKSIGLVLVFSAVLMAIMGSISSFVILLVCRALLGASQVFLGPSTSKLVQSWFPVQERAKANGSWSIGMLVAQIISMPLTTWMVTSTGWRGNFYILALISTIPFIFSILFIYNTPSKHPKVLKEDNDYITKSKVEETTEISKSVNSFGFLKRSTFWYNAIVVSLISAVNWGIVSWLPTYFMTTLRLSFAEMGFVSALPYLFGAISILSLTPLMDKFNSRAWFALIGLIGSGIMLFMAMNASNTTTAVAIFCLIFVFILPITPSLYTIMQNTTEPNEVANAHGFLIGISYVFASIFPYLIGVLYNYTGDLKYGFYLLASILGIAILFCIPLIKRRL